VTWAKTIRTSASMLVLAAAANARADDVSDLQGLLNESIITTASQSREKGSSAPAISTTITAEDIRTYGIQSIDEAIAFLSLGAMTSGNLRSVEVGARGVLIPQDQGNHFLLLIDGHAVNEAFFGAARFDRGAGVPIEMVDHIEMILGPGSVLYGSSAMLGVINVVTKRVRDFDGAHVVVESEIYKSYRVAAGAGYEPRLFGAPADVALELEYYRQEGPTFTLGPQNAGLDWADGQPWRFAPTGPATGIWGGKASRSYYAEVPSGLLTFKLKNLEVTLHASTYKRAAPYNHPFFDVESDFDDPNNYELDRSAFADVKYHEQATTIMGLTARVYGDTFDYQRFMDTSAPAACQFPGVTTCRDRMVAASRWIGGELQTSLDWLKNETLVTLLGVDGRTRFVGSVTDRLDSGTNRPLASSTGVLREHDSILGAYAQQTWQPTAWLGLNGGGRLDLDERFGHSISPRAAASIQSWRGGVIKAIYAEAFRAPSWEESAWSGPRRLPPSVDLKPETVRSVEGSIEQKLGSHRLLFGAFRSWWSDLVELHVLSNAERVDAQRQGLLPIESQNAYQSRNVASIDNYGFNAGYDGSLLEGALRYGANVTGAIARRRSEGDTQPLTVAPQFFGNARISYDLPSAWPTLALAAQYAARRPADRAFDAGFSPPPFAPAQLELRATVSGPLGLLRGLSYRATLDYAFADRGPYVIGPNQSAQRAAGSQPELVPIDVFRSMVGLQYDFGGTR
jgi:outer membrane receptor for ferrienterochelin and colicin